MRTAAIITGLLSLSFVSHAQQERQLQKPGATVQRNGKPAKKHAFVSSTPAAPRQMATLGNTPVTTNKKPSATPVPASNQNRQMTPLNSNTGIKKKN